MSEPQSTVDEHDQSSFVDALEGESASSVERSAHDSAEHAPPTSPPVKNVTEIPSIEQSLTEKEAKADVDHGHAAPEIVSPEQSGYTVPETVISAPSTPTRNILQSLPESNSDRESQLQQDVNSGRARTESQSTNATHVTARPPARSSMVFVATALETIAASRDARTRKPLGDATRDALSAIRGTPDGLTQANPETIFLPLHLASKSSTIPVVVTALNCIGKLISYSYFALSDNVQASLDQPPLIERAIDTICDCFQGEKTPVEVQMQIIKSLLSAILNDKIVVHGAGLLKSVRQIYNIFLLSRSSPTQQIAQGTLTQMSGTVFERVKARIVARAARFNSGSGETKTDFRLESILSPDTPDTAGMTPHERLTPLHTETPNEHQNVDGPKMTLQTFETLTTFDDARIGDNEPTMVTRAKQTREIHRSVSGNEIPSISIHGDNTRPQDEDEEDEIYIKDAFLVLRAMCKLSTKPLSVEEGADIRSQGMRAKLLSLHLIHNILYNHPQIFTSPYATIRSSNNNEPTTFINATKQYLCLSLSRNGSSSNNRVFEVGCEIFSLMLQHLRVMLKREIEVFLKEIYLAILEKRTAPVFQKQYIIYIFYRLVKDPKALVETYLNYDCDRAALDNMYQRIIEYISRQASAQVNVTVEQENAFYETRVSHDSRYGSSDWQNKSVLPSALSTGAITLVTENDRAGGQEFVLKQESIECLVQSLRSMISWAKQGIAHTAAFLDESVSRDSNEDVRDLTHIDGAISMALRYSEEHNHVPRSPITPIAEDDPETLERIKQQKTALNNAIKQFNIKPKKGIKVLLQDGFISANTPMDIARFLIKHDKINKSALGEFLGEGDPDHIAIMHAFVDLLDFSRLRFVDALRRFLQTFRLPGEAQKIDRLMLKFAERYTAGNPEAFANADTGYVLAYSVIMLNTDQHSAQVKKRMSVEDFIKNNRGINDGADLPDEYLQGVFNEIVNNEIVLNTEREAAANLGLVSQPTGGFAANIGQALSTVGRDLQREAYNLASEEMANRTEQQFKSLLRAQKKEAVRATGSTSKYVLAQSFKHVGPMFEVTWMAYLTALSGQIQETNQPEIIRLCMEGIKLAIRISCLFDLADPRQAFVAALSRFTNLYNLNEMKSKNVEALRCLLEIAHTEANLLCESWRDILTSISQLDRFQLISTGVREQEVPDVIKRQGSTVSTGMGRRTGQAALRRGLKHTDSGYQAEIAEESRSADMIRNVDRIFTNTANLSGEAIVHFVRALTQVSWQEIQSSGTSESPRTYSLQKIVEVSGYNMTRVRFEWTTIWQVLGEHFEQVGCCANTSVVVFALDSLRQLSMRFMDIEELPGFKFQKDFLKPFENILSNANQVQVKDLVLRCLIQMIQARGDHIRSGWRTMFGVFTLAAREPYESIVTLAFDNVTQVYNDRFGIVISQGAFADLIVCLTEFSKNDRFQKKSLQAIETLKSTVTKLTRIPEGPLNSRTNSINTEPSPVTPKGASRQTQEDQYWFPILFAFHDVLMTGEDLEVRSRALNYLFDTITKNGQTFPREFWDILWRQLLYPIFMVLKSKSEMSKALNHEELSVWLSTTMIQALRNMINLFTNFFDSLEYMLDRFLDLLALCICQENDTLARIGSNCLQQLILQNVNRFDEGHWEKIVGAFVDLFARTEATALFSAVATGSTHSRKSSTISPTRSRATSNVSILQTPTRRSVSERPMTSEPLSYDTNTIIDPESTPRLNGKGPARPTLSRSNTSSSTHSLSSSHAHDRPLADHNQPPTSPSHPPPSPHESLAPSTSDINTNDQDPSAPIVVPAPRRRFFNQIITKCVLQLLMIETVSELFSNATVFSSIPSSSLLRLLSLLRKSYHFAKRFNQDRDLRTRLFRQGFMRQPPNLLKQESGSASVYVSILFRMYADEAPERISSRKEIEGALVPLCRDIISHYIELDEGTQGRNIATWRGVVGDVLDAITSFREDDFERFADGFAGLVVGVMGKEMGGELQSVVQGFWGRICECRLGINVHALLGVENRGSGEESSVGLGLQGSAAADWRRSSSGAGTVGHVRRSSFFANGTPGQTRRKVSNVSAYSVASNTFSSTAAKTNNGQSGDGV